MRSAKKKFKKKGRFFTTALVALLMISLLLVMIMYVYRVARELGFENLHINTKEVKEDIELQMVSDRENLLTMANLAAKLYTEDEEEILLLVNSFKSIGLIENIGILQSDNTLLTFAGKTKAPKELDFKDEVRKGSYISGAVNDITFKDRKVIRSAVPIKVNDNVIAILYGIINVDTLEKRMFENASVKNSQLFVVDKDTGDFIVDTINDKNANLSILQTREFLKGYSYESLQKDVLSSGKGFTAFKSKTMKGQVLYLHYSPLSFANWQIMLAEPENSVFAQARETGVLLVIVFAGIVLIMSLYLALIFSSEAKKRKLYLCASSIRKLLLLISQKAENIVASLEMITKFSQADISFFVASDGEEYTFVKEDKGESRLNGAAKTYFISRVLNLAGGLTYTDEKRVNVVSVKADFFLEVKEPELYEFMKKHNISEVILSGITPETGTANVIGIINPTRAEEAKKLLQDISVCFFMAIRNKKYLHKTETVAATDALTGLSNRMAYKEALAHMEAMGYDTLSCIYIDVNELHIINNKYGHAAGDGMLLLVANTLKEVCKKCSIYRIGGDEFLVFAKNTPEETVAQYVKTINQKIEEMSYHVSIGVAHDNGTKETAELVSEAEKRMYEEKSNYYQKKNRRIIKDVFSEDMYHITTGIKEIDTLLGTISKRYSGVFGVSLDTGMARSIITPSYLNNFFEGEAVFANAFKAYINEMISPDERRRLEAFLNYDTIRIQLSNGKIPGIEYTSIDGAQILLSVYPVEGGKEGITETVWVFEIISQ